MTSLEDLLFALLDAVPLEAGGEAAGIRIAVDGLAIALPIEARLTSDGSLRASAPRGRIATGFDPPHTMMHVAFERRVR